MGESSMAPADKTSRKGAVLIFIPVVMKPESQILPERIPDFGVDWFNTENTNPNTWNNWIPATYNNQFESSDEYMISLGNTLAAGVYYYASRIQLDGGNYQYGGYNAGGGGFWDGKTNVSGILTVGKALAT